MQIAEIIKNHVGSSQVTQGETIQSLWSGYGVIQRWSINASQFQSVVVKHIDLSQGNSHPRGWNSNIGHRRKLKSYEVEMNWYDHFAAKCDESCRIPICLGQNKKGEEIALILEDLDEAGYPLRLSSVTLNQAKTCLTWLANFHAKFLHTEPKGLWPIGTYWHLDTRPEELKKLEDETLKLSAAEIDRRLNNCQYKTLVHGDAKLANFCFSSDGKKVAAVDFQYVGGGCGMKDVVYFLGSCLSEEECELYEEELLTHYFSRLRLKVDEAKLEKEWRSMYALAWTDFHRFLKGWSPGHWKLNSYSEKLAKEVTSEILKASLSKNVLLECQKIAEKAAVKAGLFIQSESSFAHEVLRKNGGSSLSSQVVTKVDIESQRIILDMLDASINKYDFGLLTEESEDNGSRFSKDFFWCVDPLDGTLPFTEGRDGYAVSIALVSMYGETVVGVVYDPFNENLYSTSKGAGVKKNGSQWNPTKKQDQFTFCLNRSLLNKPEYPALKNKIVEIAGGKAIEEKTHGGSVMNAIWVLKGAPGIYTVVPKKEAGGGSIWDFAATVCIYNELGLPAKNAFGNALRLNDHATSFMNTQGILMASHDMELSPLFHH